MRDESYLENPLPSSDEAEQVCLGAVLLYNEILEQCTRHFGPEDLYSPFNRRVYEAMIELHQQGRKIDPITIMEVFKTKEDRADQYISITQIANLCMGLPYFSDVTEWALIIKKHSISRQALRLANNVTRDLLAGDVDPAEVIGKLEQRAMQLSTKLDSDRKDGTTGFITVKELVPVIEAQFEAYHRGESTGVPTGMIELDHILDGGGLQKKGTYVIGGREKSGKTSLALDWCYNISAIEGKTSLILTLEMSKETMLKRLYAKHTGIPYYRFRPGLYDSSMDNTYTRAMKGLPAFGNIPFKISDSLYVMEDIYRHCVKQVELGMKEGQKEVGVIMLDYLQLIGLADSRVPTLERVTKVSRQVKILASDLDVPVVVMSSLNRTRLSEEGQEPDTDNLRESGSIAFDAEAVLFVHNPSYVPGKPYEAKEITDYVLILNRQRNGPPARFPMKLIGSYMQFLTENDFNKSLGAGDAVQSKGQMFLKEQEIHNAWDNDDQEVWEDRTTDTGDDKANGNGKTGSALDTGEPDDDGW